MRPTHLNHQNLNTINYFILWNSFQSSMSPKTWTLLSNFLTFCWSCSSLFYSYSSWIRVLLIWLSKSSFLLGLFCWLLNSIYILPTLTFRNPTLLSICFSLFLIVFSISPMVGSKLSISALILSISFLVVFLSVITCTWVRMLWMLQFSASLLLLWWRS